MKSWENHYSFIRRGRNGSLLLIFNILGIEPSSRFIFGKVEGRYRAAVIELKRGFAKNKTLQMSHVNINIRCLRGAEASITSQPERGFTSLHSAFTQSNIFKVDIWTGGTSQWRLIRQGSGSVWVFCLQLFAHRFCGVFPQSFGWGTILRLYFNFLNQLANL